MKSKCQPYWPESVDEMLTFGRITVTLLEIDAYSEFVRRKLLFHASVILSNDSHPYYFAIKLNRRYVKYRTDFVGCLATEKNCLFMYNNA